MELGKFLKQTQIVEESDSGPRTSHPIFVFLSPIIFMLASVIVSFAIVFIPALIVSITNGGDVNGLKYYLVTSPLGMIIGTGSSIIVVFLWIKFFEKRKIKTMGFHKNGSLKSYTIGFIIGLILLSLSAIMIIYLCDLTITKANFTTSSILPFMFAILAWCIQGAEEEILLRGFMMPKLSKRFNVWVGVISNSVIFALLHLFNGGISILAIINLILFGIFASVYVLYTDNLWGACAIHSAWNFAQGNIFGFLVSGSDSTYQKILNISYNNNNLINGGKFGPEGGLAVSLILIVSTLIILYLLNRKKNLSTNLTLSKDI